MLSTPSHAFDEQIGHWHVLPVSFVLQNLPQGQSLAGSNPSPQAFFTVAQVGSVQHHTVPWQHHAASVVAPPQRVATTQAGGLCNGRRSHNPRLHKLHREAQPPLHNLQALTSPHPRTFSDTHSFAGNTLLSACLHQQQSVDALW